MSETIQVFTHHAMATYFQIRMAGQESDYAAGAARMAFDRIDHLEGLLSRFRENSEIRQIAALEPGESMRLSEPTFACLEIALSMEAATQGAFSVAAAALQTQNESPRWSLDRSEFSIRCESGRLDFDLGAIGKGFALDRIAEELADWDCPAFLFIAGGSSILAGAPPPNTAGWSSGLGEDQSDFRLFLTHCSLSGSGLAVKGEHIIDPRTGEAIRQRPRAWAIAATAAESDALSTACMVLSDAEIAECVEAREDWLVFLGGGNPPRHFGRRRMPSRDPA